MRGDQIGGWPRVDRRQSQPTLERKVNPVGQRGFQFGKGFPLGCARGDQAAKTWNARGETFILAEKRNLREFESLPAVFFHPLHDCTVLETGGCFQGLKKGERVSVRLLNSRSCASAQRGKLQYR